MGIFEKIDIEHIKINGCLIDCVAIKHWLETNSWAHHSPHRIVLPILGSIIAIYHDTPGKNTKSNLFLWLALLTGYGYHIPDKVFSVVAGKCGYVRDKAKNDRGFYQVHCKMSSFTDWENKTRFTQLTERII